MEQKYISRIIIQNEEVSIKQETEHVEENSKDEEN